MPRTSFLHTALAVSFCVVALASCGKKAPAPLPVCTDSGAIHANSIVKIAIKGYADGEAAPFEDSGTGTEMLRIGSGRLPKGLELALQCKKPGDSVHVTLAPADAFGEAYIPTQLVPAAFGPAAQQLQVGRDYEIAPGLRATVTKIDGGHITADVPNTNPLAGKTVRYDVDVKTVTNQ